MNTNLHLMIRKLTVLLSICVIAALPTAPVEAAMTPTQTVKEAVGGVLKILKDKRLNREQRWLEIGKIIDTRFDFRSMSQSILATNWRTATTEEKRRFVEFFSQYLEDTYRTKIEAYSGQRVEYLGEQVRKDRAIVDTQIVTDKVRIPITYRLKNNDGKWFAYDVVIEGISLVNNYRNTFSAIIKAEGMDGLLLDLEGRIASYKEKHGGLPPE
ncbi:MAG: ABC transporter substrate-binding protein [Proteobacteria bacterium]|nr:ABC transporter substrate-binding protein [Pseudomonadota bacterium]MCZ6894186.1 ABC transporter substrate-binding protein [Gammaproteobacteria bacterium]